MKLLITGGAGYIGSKLVPYLSQQGHTITVFDRFDFGCNLPANIPGVTIRQVDLLHTQVADYAGYDLVLHLAGLSNDPMANFTPANNFVENLAATALTAYQAKQAGVKRFIFASSCSVYGNNGGIMTDEWVTPKVESPYGLSKIQSESTLNYLASNDFRITSLRQATVYGWAPRMRTDLVVNTMTKTSVLDSKIYMHNRDACRPLIHIDDLVRVYAKIIDLAYTSYTPPIINVGVKNYSIGELAQEIQATLQDRIPGLEIIDNNVPDSRSYLIDNRLMTTLIGRWKYVTVADAVEELIQNMPISDREGWANPNWINIEMYKKLIESRQ